MSDPPASARPDTAWPRWAAPLVERTVGGFRAAFGRAPSHVVVAPGRVNLIGEHTDIHGGPVLPMAIARATVAAFAARDDREVRVRSAARPGEARVRLEGGDGRSPAAGVAADDPTARAAADPAAAADPWLARPAALLACLDDEGLRPPGFDAYLDGDLPLGAGLSSSAALGVALALAAEQLAGLPLDPRTRARAVMRAEHACGTPCGLMDPLVISAALPGHALHLDCDSERWHHVPLPAGLELVVVDSGQRHQLSDGAYARRRADCEDAAARLGLDLLARAGEDDLARLENIRQRRRARHVVRETARVGEVERAFGAGDLEAAGALLDAGHASLRDDLEVTTRRIDRMVSVLRGPPRDDVLLGARLTGGGFGGCLVVLARPGGLACVRERLELAGMPVRAFATPAVGAARVASLV